MTQDNPVSAPIYMLNYRPGAARLSNRLKRAGFTPIPWPGQAQADRMIPRFCDLSIPQPETLSLSPDSINILYLPATSPLADLPEPADIVLTDPHQIETLKARLKLCQRDRRCQRENQLRQDNGYRLKPIPSPTGKEHTRRLLWLGPEAPFLNPLKYMLKPRGIEVCAAISAYTGEHYLSTHEIDLICLYPKRVDDDVMQLLHTLLGMAQPHPWQKVLILDPQTNAIVSGKAADGADLILDTSDNLEHLVDKLARLAGQRATALEAHRTHAHLNTLATRQYLETHIGAQMQESDWTEEPLTLVGLLVDQAEYVTGLIETVLPLLRQSDLAARIDDNTVALSLPGTDFRGASLLVKRLQSSLQFGLQARIIQKRNYHSAKSLLGGLTATVRLRHHAEPVPHGQLV